MQATKHAQTKQGLRLADENQQCHLEPCVSLSLARPSYPSLCCVFFCLMTGNQHVEAWSNQQVGGMEHACPRDVLELRLFRPCLVRKNFGFCLLQHFYFYLINIVQSRSNPKPQGTVADLEFSPCRSPVHSTTTLGHSGGLRIFSVCRIKKLRNSIKIISNLIKQCTLNNMVSLQL